MAIRRFGNSSITSAGGKSSKFWDQETSLGTFESIATATVDSSGVSSITFSNIPQNYAHLQIRGIGRVDRAGYAQNGCRIRLNGDSNSNYAFHQLYGNGSSIGSEGYASQTEMNLGELPSVLAASGIFGAVIVDILDYSNTSKNTTIREIGANDRNGAGQIGYNSGLWLNTAAVTSITLLETASNWVQYTNFALYGIRGA